MAVPVSTIQALAHLCLLSRPMPPVASRPHASTFPRLLSTSLMVASPSSTRAETLAQRLSTLLAAAMLAVLMLPVQITSNRLRLPLLPSHVDDYHTPLLTAPFTSPCHCTHITNPRALCSAGHFDQANWGQGEQLAPHILHASTADISHSKYGFSWNLLTTQDHNMNERALFIFWCLIAHTIQHV